MRLSLRISFTLIVVAGLTVVLLFLLSKAGIIRLSFFNLLPILLFSSILIGGTAILFTVWVDLPLKNLLHHATIGNAEGLQSIAALPGDIGHLAGILARLPGSKPLEQEIGAVYRNLIETAPYAIILLDADCTISFCNQYASALCGYSSGAELYGKSFYECIASEQRELMEQQLATALRTKKRTTFELTMRIRINDAARFAAEAILSDIGSIPGHASACSLFLYDISSRKKAEENKLALERQLRAVYKMEALGQLANGIAHDLNNSLGAISGYIDLIKKTDPGDEARIKKYAATIASSAQRSARLIQHLLTFARKSKMQITSFDVNEIITDTVKLLESTLDKSIAITLELNARDAMVTGDPGQLQNAIVNLAINARDAMAGSNNGTLLFKTGNIVIDEAFAKSHSYKMTQGYYLSITVSDTGVGMDIATMEHLFEPFFSTKETGKGTGLGLASVYGSVKSHHGYIEVDSEPNRGSSFVMYLPISQASVQETTALPALAKRHILVVDDDLAEREMLAELLNWLGYTVSVFADPQEAMAYYGDHHADVHLTIINGNMQGIDGIEFFRRLRTINPKAKALFATGYCPESKRQSILGEGVAGIIPKPFISADLSKAVADALA